MYCLYNITPYILLGIYLKYCFISTLRFRPSQNPEKAKEIVIDKCAANLQIKL